MWRKVEGVVLCSVELRTWQTERQRKSWKSTRVLIDATFPGGFGQLSRSFRPNKNFTSHYSEVDTSSVYSQGQTQFQRRDSQAEEEQEESMEGKGSMGPRLLQQLQDYKPFTTLLPKWLGCVSLLYCLLCLHNLQKDWGRCEHSHCSSNQEGLSAPGGLSFMLNCLRVCSNCCWLPAK